jgi:hypothetical protein
MPGKIDFLGNFEFFCPLQINKQKRFFLGPNMSLIYYSITPSYQEKMPTPKPHYFAQLYGT